MYRVTYSVIINGESKGSIKPTRSLRQGDPLSPYLFLLCEEGLSGLVKDAELAGRIHGVKVCRGSPSVSHLFFADDTLIFNRGNEAEVQNILAVLLQGIGATS